MRIAALRAAIQGKNACRGLVPAGVFAYLCDMKKWSLIILVLLLFISGAAFSQCSICTKTVQQMGEQPAKGLNAGILYLATMPFLIFSYIGYRWWKSQRED